MKKFIAFLKSLFKSPKKDLKKILPTLEELQKQMLSIEAMDNKVEAIVRLFQVISPVQDSGGFSQTLSVLQAKNYGQLTETIGALEILQKHINNAGRSPYGMNQTKKGQEVTAADVFLGDVFGIWTKPASYWLSKQDELKKEFRVDISKDPKNPVTTWYCLNDYQAGIFVKSHTDGILEKITILLAA
ncbi:MAG: hypothetical protein Athens071416_216 [Parcubacteria group bacterium Athens0714_16]|nr:MAG: hypothetical protein Athens071416_216 [Parcubacteria group bacterium Athens0714_16]